jgi:iron complex outermembrane receptor protein
MALPAAAQQASITGIAVDSATNRGVDDVRVTLERNGVTAASAFTDASGRFTLTAVQAGRYIVRFARLDYVPQVSEAIDVSGDAVVELTVRLVARALTINPVIVSASRSEEKALEAPAAVTVVDRRTIDERTALTAVDHAVGTPGIDVATTGITQHEMVVRGFNNSASGALMVLTDGRYAHVPSLRINVYNFIPLTDEDVERLEIVRGPGAALYGPNSADGVFHLITRSPFDDPGLTVTAAGGERALFRGGFRYAKPLSDRIAIKVSGQYLRGADWGYTDPDEASKRLIALAEGADPDTLLLGRRDTIAERMSGELRLDWRPTSGTSVITTVGANQAMRSLALTPLGAAQIQDWRYLYVQSRVTHGRLFAQAFLNSSDAGDTYLLRNANRIVDDSRMLVAQVQHGVLLGTRVNLTYGADFQRTVPRTGSTITGRNEAHDNINEVGGYLHSDITLSPALRLVAAARVDYHDGLADPIFSPRAALVMQPSPQHTVRLSYNRAFSTPTTNNLSTDIIADLIPTPIPIPVRLVGVPTEGFTFKRDCDGGLCMKSPYTPDGLGGEAEWLPIDATLLWPVIVDSLASLGIDLTALPAPTTADVGTNLGRLDIATAGFDPVSDVSDLPPLKPTITNSVELGYRGLVADWLRVGVDVYRGWKNDFVGAERVETPNAFFDEASLAAYLSNFLPVAQAAPIAARVAQAPVATVVPIEARDPYDILVTYRNFGDLGYWGADLELGAALGRSLVFYGSYSWTEKNIFDVVNAAGEPDSIPLNAPKDRVSLGMRYRNDDVGFVGEVRGRAVSAFPIQSGVYAGTVDAYGVVDASLGYRLPFAPQITLSLSATNVFDNRHREFIGAPEIGRLLLLRARAQL